MSKVIFLDRDGTINEDVVYLKKTEDIKIFPNTLKALRNFKKSGFLNIIITNQSGIARGYFTEEDLEKIHTEFRKLLRDEKGDLIDDIYFSPFHKDGIIERYKKDSDDRKPNTGMVRKALSKYNISLKESFFIGDSFTDMLCAKNAGLKRILVQTGYGAKDFERCKKENLEIDYLAKDLFDASEYLNRYSKDLQD
jgi:D,D-heptose 1,7-bisphosphate phosphatase